MLAERMAINMAASATILPVIGAVPASSCVPAKALCPLGSVHVVGLFAT
jgi:hypothetical protein